MGGGNGGNGGGSKLTPQQQAICKDLQVSEEEFLKSRSELAS
jgi:phage I-like protein